MARGFSQGVKKGGFRRGGPQRNLRTPILLGAIGLVAVLIVGGLFYFASKAEQSAPPKALITNEAKNVGGD